MSLLTLFTGLTDTKAQSFNPQKHNYLVLSKNVQQLQAILLTAEELAKEDGEKYGEFHIVICGKTVTELVGASEVNPIVARAMTQQVKVLVCGLSLSKFKVNPEQLHQGIVVVENGILYGFQWMKKGGITLSI